MTENLHFPIRGVFLATSQRSFWRCAAPGKLRASHWAPRARIVRWCWRLGAGRARGRRGGGIVGASPIMSRFETSTSERGTGMQFLVRQCKH